MSLSHVPGTQSTPACSLYCELSYLSQAATWAQVPELSRLWGEGNQHSSDLALSLPCLTGSQDGTIVFSMVLTLLFPPINSHSFLGRIR